MAVAAFASAGVERYQTQSMTITAVQPKDSIGQWTNVWTHTYNVVLNPCDNTFTGTGQAVGTGSSGVYTDETITGHFDGTTLRFTATSPRRRHQVRGENGRSTTDGDARVTTNPGSPGPRVQRQRDDGCTSNYKNHGDYVSSQGGGSDAAHSSSGCPFTKGLRDHCCSLGAAFGPPPSSCGTVPRSPEWGAASAVASQRFWS